jgi:hypothetical protein
MSNNKEISSLKVDELKAIAWHHAKLAVGTARQDTHCIEVASYKKQPILKHVTEVLGVTTSPDNLQELETTWYQDRHRSSKMLRGLINDHREQQSMDQQQQQQRQQQQGQGQQRGQQQPPELPQQPQHQQQEQRQSPQQQPQQPNSELKQCMLKMEELLQEMRSDSTRRKKRRARSQNDDDRTNSDDGDDDPVQQGENMQKSR